jgi:hypothetical protein
MKSFFKMIGIIAMVAIIGLSFAACGDDGSGGNNGGGGKTSPLLNSIADMRVWLAEQPANTKSSAYTVKLNIDDTANFSDLKTLLNNAADKYVYLDLSYGFITTIPNRAFSSCVTLTGISIPNSINGIEYRTFYECTNLASVNFGNGVEYINSYAFYGCTSLVSINIVNGVKYISENAFENCTSLTSVSIPNSVTEIWYSAFENCTSLTSITIPNSGTYIYSDAFYGCTSLTKVTFQGETFLVYDYVFLGDLDDKYDAGGAGTYTTTAPVSSNSIWTKQS